VSRWLQTELLVENNQFNVSVHMLIWFLFFFFLLWYLQLVLKICPPLSVTLCVDEAQHYLTAHKNTHPSPQLLHFTWRLCKTQSLNIVNFRFLKFEIQTKNAVTACRYCLWELENWHWGFESHSEHELCRVFSVFFFCVSGIFAMGQFPVQKVLPN
jgi:hypothetical protein